MGEKQKMGERISLIENKEESIIEIKQNVVKWKIYALIIWLICWLFCGFAFGYEMSKREDQGELIFLGVLLGAWLFIFYRILRVTIWRIVGRELITFAPGKIKIKNAFGKMGKNQSFNLPHILTIKEVKTSKYGFFQSLENSFWIIGDNKFEFNYMNKTYQFGKQLNQNEVRTMKRVVEKLFRRYKSKS